MGIYCVYLLLKGSLEGFQQLGALHPKGFPSIFPMIFEWLCLAYRAWWMNSLLSHEAQKKNKSYDAFVLVVQ